VAAGDERFEPAGVERVDRKGEPVAVDGGLMASEPRTLRSEHDTGLQVLVPGRRRRVPPDDLAELINAERLIARHCEGGEDECLQGIRRGTEPSSVRGSRTEIPTQRICTRFCSGVNDGCTGSVPPERTVISGA
jgi:hypothetical protein